MARAFQYQTARTPDKVLLAAFSALRSQVGMFRVFLEESWEQEQERWQYFAPLMMGGGIAVYFYLPVEPPLWLTVSAWPCAAGLWLWVSVRSQLVSRAKSLIAFVLIGFALAATHTAFAPASDETFPIYDAQIVGKVLRIEPTAKGGTRLIIDARIEASEGSAGQLKLRLSTPRQLPDIVIGSVIETVSDIKALPRPVMPNGFDYGRKLWFEGVRGVAFTLAPINVVRVAAEQPFAIDVWAQQVRHEISTVILSQMSQSGGAIAAAFLTGERSRIPESDNLAMRDSSLAHLLSISGLHMVIVGFGAFTIIRTTLLLFSRTSEFHLSKKIAALAAVVVSAAYLVLSGGSVPTQRAFISVGVVFLAIMLDRNALTMRTVAFAAMLVLVASPVSWLDPSFQMSFAAVAALVSVYEWWNRVKVVAPSDRSIVGRVFATIVASAATSAVAGLATAPYSAFHFNRLSMYGVVANVLVMPVVSLVIMPAGICGLVLMPFGIEGYAFDVMDWGISAMLRVAHWVASWPLAAIGIRSFSVESLFVLTMSGAWIVIWQTRWRWLGVLPLSLALAFGFLQRTPDIIISGNGTNVAVRDASGTMRFASSRAARFDAEVWLRSDGDARALTDVLKEGSVFDCDQTACVTQSSKFSKWVAFSATLGAKRELCDYADILVIPQATVELQLCKRPQLIIDAPMIEREGAISIQLMPDGVVWTSARQQQGVRPWVTN